MNWVRHGKDVFVTLYHKGKLSQNRVECCIAHFYVTFHFITMYNVSLETISISHLPVKMSLWCTYTTKAVKNPVTKSGHNTSRMDLSTVRVQQKHKSTKPARVCTCTGTSTANLILLLWATKTVNSNSKYGSQLLAS